MRGAHASYQTVWLLFDDITLRGQATKISFVRLETLALLHYHPTSKVVVCLLHINGFAVNQILNLYVIKRIEMNVNRYLELQFHITKRP